MTTRSTWFLAALVVVMGAKGEAAADLFTAPLQVNAGQTVQCSAINVDKKPVASMTLELLDPNAVVIFGPQPCSNLPPGGYCTQILINGGTPRLVYCKIAVKSKKIRGIVMNTSTGNSSEAR
jgi:hypothetical protein